MIYLQIGMVFGVILALAFLAGYLIKSVREGVYWEYPVTQDTLEACQQSFKDIDLDPYTYGFYVTALVILNLGVMGFLMLLGTLAWPGLAISLLIGVVVKLRYK
jgi:hypothetical protein